MVFELILLKIFKVQYVPLTYAVRSQDSEVESEGAVGIHLSFASWPSYGVHFMKTLLSIYN